MKRKVAVITTHPVQYYAPLFQLLAADSDLELKVFYTWPQAQERKYDPGFAKIVEWDIPLLEGYEFEFVKNTSNSPGTHHFTGIRNPGLNKAISSWAPDYLWVYGWSFESHLQAMRYFSGQVPVWFRGDSHLLDPISAIKKCLRRSLLRWVYSHVDLAFYVGEQNYRYYKWCGLSDRQLVWAPHAVDNYRFSDPQGLATNKAQAWRSELGIGKDDLVFLFAGKFVETKGVLDLIEAFLEVSEAKAKLLLVGSGGLEQPLKEKSAKYPNILWLPAQNQSQMPVVYRMADWFVYPSRGETWGLAVNEAMASGVPCIVSDRVGCAADLIKDGKTGYVFQVANRSELREVLEQRIENREEQKIIGKQALELIQAWSFEHIRLSIKSAL